MLTIPLPWPLAPIMIPIADWLPEYKWREMLLNDVTAGFTVFVFLIPQGMAYALLAGMPPIYGLYSSIVPIYMYVVLGTSRQLSLGPMAITSLLLNVSLQGYGAEEQSQEYIDLMMNLSMVVGLVVFVLGIFRLGILINLIGESVLTGFLTASALVIFLNQVKYIFGLNVPRFDYTYQTIGYILSHLGESNGNACGLGIATFVVLYAVRHWKKNNKPTPERMKSRSFQIMQLLAKMMNLLCIVFGSVIAYCLYANGLSLDIVGSVPSGLKAPSVSSMGFSQSIGMVPGGLAIAFVAFAGNWAVSKKYSAEYNYPVDATQELIALGMSIIVGTFFNSFAGSGGLARSTVNAESGAQTQIASAIAATLIVFAVLFLTKLFYYIPMCVLGSVIQVSVISLLNFEAMYKAYYTHRNDCIVMVATFMFTFFVGVSEGLFIGIFISIAMIVRATAFPEIVHVGKLPDSDGGHYKNLERFQTAEQHPGIAIVRMDATLFFANCEHFKDTALRAVAGEFHSSDQPIRKLVIDASCWIDIDLAGVRVLSELKETARDKYQASIAIVGAKGQVRDKLKNCQFFAGNMKHFHYFSIHDALNDIDRSDPEMSGEITPLRRTFGSSSDLEVNPLHSGLRAITSLVRESPATFPTADTEKGRSNSANANAHTNAGGAKDINDRNGSGTSNIDSNNGDGRSSGTNNNGSRGDGKSSSKKNKKPTRSTGMSSNGFSPLDDDEDDDDQEDIEMASLQRGTSMSQK